MARTFALLLACLLPLGSVAAAEPAAPVEGRDYVIVDAQPWRPVKGKVEIAEIFAYTCSHCAEFEPALEAWAAKLPKDAHLERVPAAYNPNDPFARGFFVAEQAGALPRTHAELFDALHHKRLLPGNASATELAWFYGQHGLDQNKVKAAFGSARVDAEMKRAREFALAVGLQGTPTLVVDGRYRITPRSHADALRIADALIARIRAKR